MNIGYCISLGFFMMAAASLHASSVTKDGGQVLIMTISGLAAIGLAFIGHKL